MKSIIGVIPARYASSRFPGKPLIDIQGMSMIERVYRQCEQAPVLQKVIVATDDRRILEHVQMFGGNVQMTADTHISGTERLAEVAEKAIADCYINIQGDEPFIHPEQIEQVGQLLLAGAQIATLATETEDLAILQSPHTAKVVLNQQQEALYFSRAMIPHPSRAQEKVPYYQHVGIYGFQRDVLLQVPVMAPSYAEQAESLEQLRWLAHGVPIKVGITTHRAVGIDTPEDLTQLLSQMRRGDEP
ncbi:MAG: 3-deoxy-manno-octulosonate cytidylyltransferase [Bacteroidota bacterium]